MTDDHKKKVVCAGIPRSGTTMMFRALAGLRSGATTPKRGNASIIKTHSFNPKEFSDVAGKAVFVFGDPVRSVISTKINRYQQTHFDNCGVPHLSPETADIYHEDCLNYEEMFDAWMQRQRFDLICIKYEKLYENLEVIDAFFGRHVYFPPKQRRKTSLSLIDTQDLSQIRKTYARLIRKTRRAPDVTIYRQAKQK